MTGLPVFKGADGSEIPATGTLKREDMVALGHSVPPFSGTFNLSFTYKNFEFAILVGQRMPLEFIPSQNVLFLNTLNDLPEKKCVLQMMFYICQI